MKKLIGAFVTVSLLVASIFFVSCSSDEDSLGGNSIPVNGQSKFNTYEKPIDVTTNATPTANTKYIYFGVFPKTVLTIGSPVTVDETKFIEMGANTYYKGSDGNYYAKVEEDACRIGEYQCYSDGTHAVQKIIGYDDYSSYRYFKVEPIKWKVLTTNYNNTNKALLLAENILTSGIQYYGSSLSLRTIDGSRVYGNNYKYSKIRAYLNGKYESADIQSKTAYDNKGFLQTAFSSTAQSIIAETEVDNSKETTEISESKYATKYACENTIDKIFLLSESEVRNNSYDFDGNYMSGTKRVRKPTDYAIANYVCTESKYVVTEAKTGGRWWLRSPRYDSSNSAYTVGEWGWCDSYEDAAVGYCGVVPALCISLE